MTEQELIHGCQRQDAYCQHLLFRQYSEKFMGVCVRYAIDNAEAEDILQEGFIRIFRYIHQFKGEGSFEGWMRRIVVNCALKVIQKRKIHFVEANEVTLSATPQIHATALDQLSAQDILRLVNALPPGYKTVFNLIVVEGFSHEEVAELLGIQASTSRSQLVKARKMLQNQLAHLQKMTG
ncbi:MAG: sigma-70 family RNA polymerase sigma factor [Bacteroidetes bacterium]|nr:MAG: sigma-70 family RNA polymerase sigma factor [Bacteroidota bacterium]TAF97677.1 MAG: sigma-70 family RNA polymerase sigma factor [Bacteroidota bacterium]